MPAQQERPRSVGCGQRRAGCEHRSADSNEPSREIGVADAGRAGAETTAIEISPPANRSARPSRDATRMRPLLHSPTRPNVSRCQIRLGEHPPPVRFIHRGSSLLGQNETGRCQAVACRQHRHSRSLHISHSSMSRGACQVILKKIFDLCCWAGFVATFDIKVAGLWGFLVSQKFSDTAS